VHDAGIVHRDFKSQNVILSPRKDGSTRAVITDFGIARLVGAAGGAGEGKHDAASEDDRLTAAGTGLLGTPAYMAPEQVRNEEITPAADIYALGVVLFEMVTGEVPFRGTTPQSTATLRLERPAPSPRERVPSLDPRWETVILRCLERDPARRFRRAIDVARALDPAPASPGRKRLGVAALALTLALAAVVGSIFVVRAAHHASPPAAPRPSPPGAGGRRTVAVLGFRNLSQRPEAGWISTAIAETVRAELAAGPDVRVLSGETVARLKINLSLPDGDSLAPDTLTRVHDLGGVDQVVVGSYYATGERGGKIKLNLELQDAATGEAVAQASEETTDAELPGAVARLSARLSARPGAPPLDEGAARMALAAVPSGAEAARLYAEGLDRLRAFDNVAARDLFEQATLADPDHPMLHSALSRAWGALGDEAKAREEARIALDRAGALSPPERALLEARYRVVNHELGAAITIYQGLLAAAPDNLEVGLALADAQIADRNDGAEATIAALRKLPPPGGDDLRIDLTAASLLTSRTRNRDALVELERAADKARAQGARLALASIRKAEIWPYSLVGEPDHAMAAASEAAAAFEAIHDRFSLAQVLEARGTVRQTSGDGDGAAQDWEAALAVFREIGAKQQTANLLGNFAFMDLDAGYAVKARARLGPALLIARQIDDRFLEGYFLFLQAWLLLEEGDVPAAREKLDETLRVRTRNGERNTTETQRVQAHLALLADDVPTARRLAAAAEAGDKPFATPVSDTYNLMLVANIDLQDGAAARAEAAARRGAAYYAQTHDLGSEADSRLLLGEALADQGRLAEAREELQAAHRLNAGHDLPAYHAWEEILAARLDPGVDQLARLDRLLETLTQAGDVWHALELRLARGEAEAALGRPGAATALQELAAEARAHGFLRIAREADEHARRVVR
jgi:TolB-like protein